jgi:hypothetical protein
VRLVVYPRQTDAVTLLVASVALGALGFEHLLARLLISLSLDAIADDPHQILAPLPHHSHLSSHVALAFSNSSLLLTPGGGKLLTAPLVDSCKG